MRTFYIPILKSTFKHSRVNDIFSKDFRAIPQAATHKKSVFVIPALAVPAQALVLVGAVVAQRRAAVGAEAEASRVCQPVTASAFHHGHEKTPFRTRLVCPEGGMVMYRRNENWNLTR